MNEWIVEGRGKNKILFFFAIHDLELVVRTKSTCVGREFLKNFLDRTENVIEF